MESDPRQILANAWPFIAIVLMSSGILVSTVPLESKRPTDPNRVKFYHAGRQDVEARLWQDPFVVMQHVTTRGLMARCEEAINDRTHHPSALGRAIEYQTSRNSARWITVLPVMVQGGPYVEDGEGRRRARYAVVTALLNSGWKPSDEDKLGYVWTFESCILQPWKRRVPELLPYEWYVPRDQFQEPPRALLVLWVDEDALVRPLAGIERIIERLGSRDGLCLPSYDEYDAKLREKLETLCKKPKEGSNYHVDHVAPFSMTPGALNAPCLRWFDAFASHRSSWGGKRYTRDPQNIQERQIQGYRWDTKQNKAYFDLYGDPMQGLSPFPWCDIRVIGPSTSSSLRELVGDFARALVRDLEWDLVQDLVRQPTPDGQPSEDFTRQSATTAPLWVRFYSSGATVPITDPDFQDLLMDSWGNYHKNIDQRIYKDKGHRIINPDFQNILRNSFQSFDVPEPTGLASWEKLGESFKKRVVELATTEDKLPEALSKVKNLRESFEKRVIRLTTTDDALTDALMAELTLRLADATPFLRIPFLNPHGQPLCGDTVVVISEGDTSYAQFFYGFFEKKLIGYSKKHCTEESRLQIHPVHYLRGLDGVVPEGTGAPVSASSPSGQARTNTTDVFQQATLERADGPSQYDYLRRLAAYLMTLDQREKQTGRNGVRAIGVLGNDAYDKVLVLDALRAQFPKAVFFAADLDARLLGREVIRSTQNLIVASSYGLTLNPKIQDAAPPFRDTYQSGLYLSTRVALDPVLQRLSSADFSPWFRTPQLFEIGRTRAVPLSPALPLSKHYENIHALDEQAGFSPWLNRTLVLTLLVVAVTGALGLCFLPRHTRRVVMSVVAVMLIVGIVMGSIIWLDRTSGTSEPFAWFEGVSLWPTMLLELLILLVTCGLLFYGRRQLIRHIDTVAQEFGITLLSERKPTTMRRAKGEIGVWSRIRWRRGLDCPERDSSDDGTATGPWLNFLDQMQLWPTFCRVFKMTVVFFIFGMALLNLDWPISPHRGMVSAWVNHTLLLLLLACMIALLCMVLDASKRTRDYFTHLNPSTPPMPPGEEPVGQGCWTQYPVGADTIRLWTRFHFAVRLASSVNQFIYLPLIPLLLVLPTRSRVFDAWDVPLPYIALLGISVLLAMRGAFSLRRAAAALKTQILVQLASHAEDLTLIQYSRASKAEATQAPGWHPGRRNVPSGQAIAAAWAGFLSAGQEDKNTPAPDDIPAQTKADWLRRIADEIRSVQEGPFRPLAQEPVVRALLIVSGWAGGLSTIEFLFLR